jgi:signal transduction histidine kinase
VRGGLTRRVVVASAVLVVLIAGAFAVLLVALDSARDSAALARQSRAELAVANRLEKLVVDLEAGQRGFVITREPRFLAPWGLARRTAPVVGRQLLDLADGRANHAQVARIVRAVRSYIRNYSVPFVAAARRGDPDVESVATTLRGKRLVDALRARFNRYAASERDLSTARQEEADSDARRATVVASAGLVGSIVLILVFALYLGRAIVLPIRRAAGMAGRIAGGELSARMPETGIGEVGMLEGTFNKMAASLEENQAELRRYAEQQAALRRVATLVARDVPPEELLDSVAREVAGVLASDTTGLLRYEPDGDLSLLASWTRVDAGVPFPDRLTPPAGSLSPQILSTGRPAWSEFDENDEGEAAALYHRYGLRSTLGVPIFVGGRLWGLMVTAWAGERLDPEVVEPRLSEFTELVATAIANAESRAEVAASRTRVVAASDETRRRIERNLHDGTQQRLISVGLQLRAAEALASPDRAELRTQISDAARDLTAAVEELQEISRGIHPAILSRGGLREALKSLARRSSVPVDLHVAVDGGLPEQLEVASYYLVSEALTNAAKHASASELRVDAETDDGVLVLSISDDGVGGADPEAGSGLVGLRDRVEALGGELRISSARGHGTSLHATIPIEPEGPR